MFSVDNFYTFMNSHYGLESDGRNVIWYFNPHGSKNWNDLMGGFLPEKDHEKRFINESKSVIILHDQEPFDKELLDIYRIEKSKNYKWWSYQTKEETMVSNQFQSIGWPIMCHSEWASDDIKWAEKAGCITCHYFYHGLVARDWFRHWKHHGGIHPIKNWQYRFLLYARDWTGSRQYRKSLVTDLAHLKYSINYDWNHNRKITPDYSAKISVDDAQTSAIHLVCETIFSQDKIHLTEKVFKPMVMMQPFIIFAGAGSLAYLRRYGFRTFDDIWDESYDLERDHEQRYQMIVKLVKDLSKLSDIKIKELVQKCLHVVEHNQRHFFSDRFEEILLDELKSNMAISLARQDQKVKEFPGGGCLHVFENLVSRGVQLPAIRTQQFTDILNYVKITDQNRYNAILKQHPCLIDQKLI